MNALAGDPSSPARPTATAAAATHRDYLKRYLNTIAAATLTALWHFEPLTTKPLTQA